MVNKTKTNIKYQIVHKVVIVKINYDFISKLFFSNKIECKYQQHEGSYTCTILSQVSHLDYDFLQASTTHGTQQSKPINRNNELATVNPLQLYYTLNKLLQSGHLVIFAGN